MYCNLYIKNGTNHIDNVIINIFTTHSLHKSTVFITYFLLQVTSNCKFYCHSTLTLHVTSRNCFLEFDVRDTFSL